MRDLGIASWKFRSHLLLAAFALLVACLAVAASGCGDSTESDSSGEQSSSSSSDETDGGDGQDSSSSGSGPDGTVSRENPGLMGRNFDPSRNEPLHGAQPLGVVTWTAGPSIADGALTASGTLQQGASLFDPMVEGEGAGFAVFYKGNPEPMVVLLPGLGPIDVWETTLTVAEMEHEFEGASFEIRAYSPLFMDVGPSDLELRVYGYDGAGKDALLGVQDISAR